MAFQFSPKIVTDGLVLYLDAGNTKSYSGTGTIWTDLSRSGLTASLVSGPTFNSANRGAIVFDGTDDFVSVPDSTNWDFTTSLTIELWIYVNSYDTGGVMLIHQQSGGSAGGFEIWVNTSNIILFNKNPFVSIVTTGNVFSRNIWQHVVCTHNGSTGIIYLNGINVGQANGALPDNVTGQLRIGGYSVVGSYELNGSISNVRIYKNKALTSSEVLQNYNAIKSRFGL
jgi:hypothetical protein